jgi:hypothetical protein
VYSYDAVPDAVAQVDELPVPSLSAYAELIGFLELTPWEGAPYRDDKPDGNMRTMPFGKHAEGMAVYVILEEQLRVVVVSVTWLELELASGPRSESARSPGSGGVTPVRQLGVYAGVRAHTADRRGRCAGVQ